MYWYNIANILICLTLPENPHPTTISSYRGWKSNICTRSGVTCHNDDKYVRLLMHFVILILNPDKVNFDCFRYRVNAWFLYGWFWIHTRKVCWNEILPRSSVLITFSTSISFIWIDKWPIMKTNLVYRSKISVVNRLVSWL